MLQRIQAGEIYSGFRK